jgi:hypothetical protein
MRYFYQGEFRLVWLPDEPRRELEPIFLDLGNLGDSCELVVL